MRRYRHASKLPATIRRSSLSSSGPNKCTPRWLPRSRSNPPCVLQQRASVWMCRCRCTALVRTSFLDEGHDIPEPLASSPATCEPSCLELIFHDDLWPIQGIWRYVLPSLSGKDNSCLCVLVDEVRTSGLGQDVADAWFWGSNCGRFQKISKDLYQWMPCLSQTSRVLKLDFFKRMNLVADSIYQPCAWLWGWVVMGALQRLRLYLLIEEKAGRYKRPISWETSFSIRS